MQTCPATCDHDLCCYVTAQLLPTPISSCLLSCFQVQHGDSALEKQHKVMDGPGLRQGLEASKKRRALMDGVMPLRVSVQVQ